VIYFDTSSKGYRNGKLRYHKIWRLDMVVYSSDGKPIRIRKRSNDRAYLESLQNNYSRNGERTKMKIDTCPFSVIKVAK
jgi:hypothetical protein